MKNKKILLFSMYVTIFIVSFGFIMYSALVSAFSGTYQISLPEAGSVGSVLCVGQLVMIFLNDLLAEKISRIGLMILGVAAHVISMFWIAVSTSFGSLTAAFFLNGAAISLLNVVMSAYISDLFGEKRNSYLNIFHGVYGLGSLSGPLLPTAILVSGLDWKISYLVIGVLSVALLAAMIILVRKEKASQPTEKKNGRKTAPQAENAAQEQVYSLKNTKEGRTFFALLKSSGMLTICAAALLFMGFDMTISTYMSSYLGQALNAASVAGLTITFYWTGSAVGRLLYPVLFAKYDTRKYLIMVNVITAVLLLLGVGVKISSLMILLIFLTGLLSGVNFPLEIGLACEMFPENSVGATNAVSIFGSLGGIIFPMLAGQFMEHMGYKSLLILCGVMMLLIAGCLLLLIKKREELYV